MILGSANYLSLLALSAWILLLHFLRTRRERQEVAHLSLWERLPEDPRTRAARIRVHWDPLLVLQLLVLAALVLALSAPAFLTQKASLANLAIVLDGSASLRARTASGEVAADLVRAEALNLLDRYAATSVAVFELSASPRVLVPLSAGRELARQAIAEWEPTWLADGPDGALGELLASQGAFEHIALLTDHEPAYSLPGLVVTAFAPGENMALTAFSVRENPGGTGAVAFVRVRNGTSSFREARVRLSDGAASVLLPAFLAPGEERAYVLPFPLSLGPVFHATIDEDDAFAADNARVFSLARRVEWRVRVLGTPDRYVNAALRSMGGVRFLDASDPVPADVTVACNVGIPEDVPGAVLLVHSSLPGVVELGDVVERGEGSVVATSSDDPLLRDVDPQSFVVARSPTVRALSEGVAVLSVEGEPVVWRAEVPGRRVVLLAPDPIRTNLPLTVDFPVLVGNVLRWLCLGSSLPPPQAVTAGASIAFAPYGVPERLKDPTGRETDVDSGAYGFIAKAPGIYEIVTSSGAIPIAVNVDGGESPRPLAQELPPLQVAAGPSTLESAVWPAWWIPAALGFLLLTAECVLYHRPGLRRWRR